MNPDNEDLSDAPPVPEMKFSWQRLSQRLDHLDSWLKLLESFGNTGKTQCGEMFARDWESDWELVRSSDIERDSISTLRTSSAFRNAVDTVGIVAVADRRGVIIEVNENFCKLSGYSTEKIVGKHHRALHSGHDARAIFRQVYLTVGEGKAWRGDICSRTKDGKIVWVDTVVVPMFGEEENLIGYFSLGFDVTERKKLAAHLRVHASTDALTNLPNRDSVLDSIEDAMDRSNGFDFALLFVNLDGFQLVNGSFGYDRGDDLLREVASRMQSVLPSRDGVILARLGGDEFLVLLQNWHDTSHPVAVAELLLDEISASYRLGEHTVYPRASIGIAIRETDPVSANDMIRDAALAMREAKSGGKGGYAMFHHGLRQQAQARLKVESEQRERLQTRIRIESELRNARSESQ